MKMTLNAVPMALFGAVVTLLGACGSSSDDSGQSGGSVAGGDAGSSASAGSSGSAGAAGGSAGGAAGGMAGAANAGGEAGATAGGGVGGDAAGGMAGMMMPAIDCNAAGASGAPSMLEARFAGDLVQFESVVSTLRHRDGNKEFTIGANVSMPFNRSLTMKLTVPEGTTSGTIDCADTPDGVFSMSYLHESGLRSTAVTKNGCTGMFTMIAEDCRGRLVGRFDGLVSGDQPDPYLVTGGVIDVALK